jgi:hypothetical protein
MVVKPSDNAVGVGDSIRTRSDKHLTVALVGTTVTAGSASFYRGDSTITI